MIKVTLTNEILKYITEIDKNRYAVSSVKLSGAAVNKLRKNSKKKSSYASTKIEGNPLSEKQVDEVIESDVKPLFSEDPQILNDNIAFKPIEFNVLVGKLGDSLDYEAAIMGLTGSGLEPNNGANVWYSYGTLHLFNIRKPDEYNKVTDITPWEKRIDEIFAKAATIIDFDERKKYYDEYQQIVYDENPFIYLYSPLNIYAVRKKFGNINPTPIGGVIYNLEEIYLK